MELETWIISNREGKSRLSSQYLIEGRKVNQTENNHSDDNQEFGIIDSRRRITSMRIQVLVNVMKRAHMR